MIEIQNVKWTKIRILVFVVWLSTLLASGRAAAAEPANVNVLVEGNPLAMTVPPAIVENRTLVGVRFVGEAVGGTVEWDQARQQAKVTRQSDTIVLTLGKKEAVVNGKTVLMDVPAQLVNDRTMVPLRFIAEALGGTVEWDGNTRTANILRKPTEITALHYVRDAGYARITLQLSEPPATIRPQVAGSNLSLSLFPAAIKVPEPGRVLYDSLLKLVHLQADGRTVHLQVQAWNPPQYRYSLSEDGTILTLEFDYTVAGIQLQMDGRIPEVSIAADGKLNYSTLTLPDPARLVVDLPGAHLGPGVSPSLTGASPLVTGIRTGTLGGDREGARVVLDLAKTHPVDIISTDLGLLVRFVPHLWAVRTEKLPGRTRLRLPFSLPVDAKVTASAAQKQILIEVPQGASALKENTVWLNDGTVESVQVEPGAQRNSLLITVSLPYYLGYTVVSKNGEAEVAIDLITSPVYGKRIWVDAGHGKIPGGKDDPGAVSAVNRIREKDVNLAIALELQRLLQEAGAVVHMTRTGDAAVDFRDRPHMVNAVKPAVDLFLSIHHNSTTTPATRGTETYYWTANPLSRKAAEAIHPALVKGLGFPDRRIRLESFTVIKETLAPAILLEMGYLSNAAEEKAIADRGYPLKAAQAIKTGLFTYFGAGR